MKFKTAFLVLLCLVGNIATASGLFEIKSSAFRQNLVELYSSEGCSSCPPAEKWVESLRQSSGLWTKFIPVEFHVDYWDGPSWTDPYSNASYSARQREYAGQWKNQNIYTPGMILNGEEWRLWRFVGTGPLTKKGESAGVLEVKEQAKSNFLVTFKDLPNSSNKKYFINAALLGNGLVSKVSGGENSGVTLRHNFVVLSFKKFEMNYRKEDYSVSCSFAKDDSKIKPASYSIAFWVTDQNQKLIQVVGGDLPQDSLK